MHKECSFVLDIPLPRSWCVVMTRRVNSGKHGVRINSNCVARYERYRLSRVETISQDASVFVRKIYALLMTPVKDIFAEEIRRKESPLAQTFQLRDE